MIQSWAPGVLLIPAHYPKYALARSMLTQSVEKTEVGRIFSSLSLASLLVPFASKPLFAFLYDLSLETFPGSWMLLTGLIIWSAMLIMIVLKYLMRSHISSATELQKCDANNEMNK